jgi:hypothetical protein
MSIYQRNNIEFRIVSAGAISKFKAAQAHAFIQLIRKDIGFNDAAKEAVLLEFDRFSDWIFRAEKTCLGLGKRMSRKAVVALHKSLIDEFALIENTMQLHSDVFTGNVEQFTEVIHTYAAQMLEEQIKEVQGKEAVTVFSDLVSLISDYLQHFLASMHELNNNCLRKKNEPFLSIVDFCAGADISRLGTIPCLMRAKYFVEAGAGNTFILKNYSDKEIFDYVSEIFSLNGINLIQENSNQLVSA